MTEKFLVPSPEWIGDRLVTLMEYTECQAESCRVVPVARLVLPATLMGRTLDLRAGLELRHRAAFGPHGAYQVAGFRILRVVYVLRHTVASC